MLLSILFSKIFGTSDLAIKNKMNDARKIMDRIDPDDSPFIALALAIENDGVWTEDKHFEKQKVVRAWKTTELLSLMNDS